MKEQKYATLEEIRSILLNADLDEALAGEMLADIAAQGDVQLQNLLVRVILDFLEGKGHADLFRIIDGIEDTEARRGVYLFLLERIGKRQNNILDDIAFHFFERELIYNLIHLSMRPGAEEARLSLSDFDRQSLMDIEELSVAAEELAEKERLDEDAALLLIVKERLLEGHYAIIDRFGKRGDFRNMELEYGAIGPLLDEIWEYDSLVWDAIHIVGQTFSEIIGFHFTQGEYNKVFEESKRLLEFMNKSRKRMNDDGFYYYVNLKTLRLLLNSYRLVGNGSEAYRQCEEAMAIAEKALNLENAQPRLLAMAAGIMLDYTNLKGALYDAAPPQDYERIIEILTGLMDEGYEDANMYDDFTTAFHSLQAGAPHGNRLVSENITYLRKALMNLVNVWKLVGRDSPELNYMILYLFICVGQYYLMKKDYKVAIKVYKNGIGLFDQSRHTLGGVYYQGIFELGTQLNLSLSDLYWTRKKYKESLKYARRSLELAKEMNRRNPGNRFNEELRSDSEERVRKIRKRIKK